MGGKTAPRNSVRWKMTHTRLVYIISPPVNPIAERSKTMITYKNLPRLYWQKVTNYKYLALNKTKTSQRCVRILQTLCTLWLPIKTQQIHSRNCFTNVLTKNKTFPLNNNLAFANYGTYVATCVICNRQYVGQSVKKFSTRRSSHWSTWNKPDNSGGSRPGVLGAVKQGAPKRSSFV